MKLADVLRPGLILNMSTRTLMGRLIRSALRRGWDGRQKDIPNHDAMIVEYGGKLWVGESKPMRASLTEISEYERRLDVGKIYNLRVLAVANATREQERGAADWWMSYVMGKPYDFMAFPRLLWKANVGDWCDAAAGWEWAWYCTEGDRDSYRHGAGLYPWGKRNPTPLTTFKRTLGRKFITLASFNESLTRKGAA